ncbi:MAG TPA: hypothetical protein VF071_03320 [Candidatus Limnocylindria bacterium]
MIRRLILAAALLLPLLAASPASATASPFIGSWSATDVDGSAMTMTIGGGASDLHRVGLVDHVGTICIDSEASSLLFHGTAIGAVDGDVLTATWRTARCGDIGFDFEAGQFAMEYLPATDQLFGMDVYWSRGRN